jgi:bifunctional non-homologous end joining protein LigD
MIAAAVEGLPVETCLIDGEAVVVDVNGLSVFNMLRYRRHDDIAMLCAFDLIELDGKSIRRMAIEHRKHALAELLNGQRAGIVFNTHFEGDGAIIYRPRLPARLRRPLCRNGSARHTGPVARIIGSRSKTQRRRR